MIIPHAAENRKIRGICPCPAIREGDTRVGVLRVSGRTNRVYARPAAGFPRCRCFPNISIIALSAPKEKGFPSLLLCFAADGGKMLFSVKALRFCHDKNQVTGVCTAKGARGRPQSPLVASADAKPSAQQKNAVGFPPKNQMNSNEIKRNQMKSNFLDEHPFPVLQYHCRNSGE